MGKTIEQHITDFSGGISTDPRTQDFRYAQMIKNFDAHTFKHKLVPLRSSESADTIPNTRQAVNFLYANSRLYALGVVSGTSRAAINYKDTFGGTGWTSPSNNESSAGTRNEDFFIHYKNYIYGARAGTTLWRHGDITGSPSWADSWDTISYTNAAQGLVHSDDILYIPLDNKVYKWDNSTLPSNANKLTLPSDRIITSIFSYGNYIGVATRPSSGVGLSKIYLWDGTATSWNEVIDWGEGSLYVADVIHGVIVGVSLNTATPGNSSFKRKVQIKVANGNRAQLLTELIADASTTIAMPLAKQVVNDYLYFMLQITINGVEQAGVWKVGRVDLNSPFSVVYDRTPKNDTALSSGTLEGFFLLGEYMFQAFVSGSEYDIRSTDDAATYSATSIYETPIITGGNSHIVKQMKGITVMFEPLPSAGQVVLKYKADSETSFTTLFTETTDNAIKRSITSSEVSIPTFKEVTLRVESTGGAVITGLHYKAEETREGMPY